jgi:hypothetical protein
MSNDFYIDEEERPDEEALAQMEAEYHFWKISQDALPPHKQDGYAERMAEMADLRRKQIREELI